jgi:hypothetical protein
MKGTKKTSGQGFFNGFLPPKLGQSFPYSFPYFFRRLSGVGDKTQGWEKPRSVCSYVYDTPDDGFRFTDAGRGNDGKISINFASKSGPT